MAASTTLKSALSVFACLASTFFTRVNAASPPLVGCEAVECPFDSNGFISQCVIGDVVATEIGIANVLTTEAVSPEPLTWTVAFSTTTGASTIEEIYSKDFYLGTPPSLNLSDAENYIGCALIFEAITSKLHFTGNDSQSDIGTCNDALNAACVSELMSQASSELLELINSVDDQTTICGDLGAALRDKPPQACNVDGSWGNIAARVITGPAASPSIQQSDCHPTTGTNYSIAQVDSFNMSLVPETTFIDPFLTGVTPVMTIFFPSFGSNGVNSTGVSATAAAENQLYLTCLKSIPDIPTEGNVKLGASTTLRPDIGFSAFTVVLIGSVLALF